MESMVAIRAVIFSLALPKASLEKIPMPAMVLTAVVAIAGVNPLSSKCWRSWVNTP